MCECDFKTTKYCIISKLYMISVLLPEEEKSQNPFTVLEIENRKKIRQVGNCVTNYLYTYITFYYSVYCSAITCKRFGSVLR